MVGNSSLTRLINKRLPMRKQVESLCTKIKDELNSLSQGDLTGIKIQLDSLMNYLTTLNNEVSNELEAADKDDATMQQEVVLCLDYEMKINTALANISVKLDSIQSQNISINSGNSSFNYGRGAIKLPELPLPEFFGKDTENLEDFLNNFETVVTQITNKQYEMFLYLQKSVKGEAAKLISTIRPSEVAYTCAKTTLEQAFQPTVKKKFQILESLIQTQMSYKDHVYDHYSKLQNLFAAFDRVQIDNNFLKQFFAWRSFTSSLQESFITVTNKYRPDFDEIEKFKYEAADRYKDRQKKFNDRRSNTSSSSKHTFESSDRNKTYKPKNESNSYAANLPGNDSRNVSMWCRLCKNADHKVFNCQKYPTAKQTLERIEQLGGCVRCGFENHKKDSCRFPFNRKCRHCDGSHMPWLCLKGESANVATGSVKDPESEDEADLDAKPSEHESDSESNTEIANMCTVQMKHANFTSNSILPTFQVKVNNKHFRGMRDSGCQKNFCSSSLVKKAKIVPKKDVNIVINGFNASKKYSTKLVDIPFEFGGKKFIVEAIILPNVSVHFLADGLGNIASEFVKKGYALADPELVNDRNAVGELDLLFGVDTASIFNEQTEIFGKDKMSAYLKTRGGIMLVGNSIRMIKNLDYLPNISVKPKKTKTELKSKTKLGNSSLVCTSEEHVTSVLEENFGNFIGKEKLTDSELQKMLHNTIGYDELTYNDQYSEVDERLVDYCLDKT